MVEIYIPSAGTKRPSTIYIPASVLPTSAESKAARATEVRKATARTREKVWRGYVGLVSGRPLIGLRGGAKVLRCYLTKREARRYSPQVIRVRVTFG